MASVPVRGSVITEANQVAFWSGAWERTTWRRVPIFKYPEDLWTYQEIIMEVWPTVIVETGTAEGGSAVYFQDLLDILPQVFTGSGFERRRVITIDVKDYVATHDERITYILGSSLDVAGRVESLLKPDDKVMVVLDSEHLRGHVYAELNLYAPLVTVGQYLVVEDTFISRYECQGVRFQDGSSWEAVLDWLPKNPEYECDTNRDRHLLSMNPGGWLRRVR